MRAHRLALAATAALLASCTSIPTAPPPPTATLVCEPLLSKNAECVRRIDALTASAQAGSWGMGGRAAISHGRQSGSLGVEWEDAGSSGYLVVLTAPITRQGWRLQEQGGRATLEGMAGGPRTGADGAALLRDATGFEIPVQALRHWMRGYPDPSQRLDKAAFAGDDLATLVQGGWQIDYLARDVQGRPSRINATRGDDRVRLVIDRWGPLEQ
ncbi:MAG: outer membrane lipoprotein LolB [Proteobacteria bacterium]|nr:outer membrane lipoprotein LolB [Pseudomonadota bacterium]